MYQLITLFFRIAVFKSGPQDVPSSPLALRLTVPLYALVNLLLMVIDDNPVNPLLLIVADFVMMAGFSWPLLYFAGVPLRFRQTLTALVGGDMIVNAAALPFAALHNLLPGELLSLVSIGSLTWHWLVTGHILRHALDRSWFFGLGIGLLYIMLSLQIMAALFS